MADVLKAFASDFTRPARAQLADLVTLAKPRIVLLLAITCFAGSLVAAKGNGELLQWFPTLASLVGLILSAAGANMVNMWYDRDIDPLMKRTQNRPLPAGRMHPATVLALGACLIALGSGLAACATPLAGLMALSGALFYVFVYTMGLKRRTVQNIVIGGAAGAFPPLVGWAAIQGDVSTPLPWLMFAVIFLWTPPHFWALALMANKDYTRAGIPMYPVVHGEDATRVAILRYLLLLIPVTLAGGLIPPLGWLYSAAAVALGGWWLWHAYRLLHAPVPTAQNIRPAQKVFTLSLYYLALLFAAMVVDSWL
jgi:protoheme IX farnesyltransferase